MKKYLYLLPLFLSSCSSMYIPSMTNAPLFTEKGDAQIETSLSTTSVQASAGYAFSHNFSALIAGNLSYGNICNYNDIFTKKNYESSNNSYLNIDLTNHGRYSHRYTEVAVGKYNLLHTNKLLLEAFIGGGYGRAVDDDFKNKYGLGFVQTDFGQRFSFLDWGTSCRIASSFHSYRGIDKNNDMFSSNFSLFHIEPMAFIRIGGDHFKFIHKIGISLPIKTAEYTNVTNIVDDSDYSRTTKLHLSVGVHYTF
ncbi:MAG: hypothetical protein MJ197_05445 [Bacteroidales bacterium]|nr:hypothetical protein [Bacteroidales bacterium]